jgi:hypothetical protein
MRQLEQALLEMKALRSLYDQSNLTSAKEEIASKLLQLEPHSLQLKSDADELFTKAREAEVLYWNSAGNEILEELLQSEPETPVVETVAPEIEPEIEPSGDDAVFEEDSTEIEIENVPMEVEPVSKVIYKVQIGAYSKGLPDYIDRLYKRLSVLRRIDKYTNERGVVVYTVGELSRFDDAVKLQNQIRQEGVSDAFVVAFLNGKRITLNEAQKLSE